MENQVTKTIKKNCTGCSACAAVCPKKCIVMKEDKEGFSYPSVRQELCISCGLCQEICPSMPVESEELPECYGGYHKDDKIRNVSSSGGIFSLAAKEILHKGGVVFGVIMEDVRAIHRYVETEDDLGRLCGSKYVQSELGKSMEKAKEFLNQGRWVLFCGTPCQVAGLYSFLGKTYEKLFTIDFICHGISSPLIFRKYLQEIHGKREWERISFRDKHSGWKKFGMYLKAKDGYQYQKDLTEDIYMQSFLRNMNLRPSCFQCRFRTVHRMSDWTLGDLWGAEEMVSGWVEDEGYSLILLQSEKGKQMWETVKGDAEVQAVQIDEVIRHNASLIASPWDFYTRDLFFKYATSNTLQKSIELAGKETLLKRIKRKGITMWRRNA